MSTESLTLLRNAPHYVNALVAAGYIRCAVPDKGEAPALAWTTFDKKARAWVINFRPEAATLSVDAQKALWRHEIGHIAFAHFQKDTCTPDDPIRSHMEQNEVGDLQINTYIVQDAEDEANLLEVGKLNKQISGVELPDNPGFLDPRIILPQIGLPFDEYPYEVIHAYLHQKVDKQLKDFAESLKSFCGGIEQTDADGAETAAAVIVHVAAGDEEGPPTALEKHWGSSAGNRPIYLPHSSLPPWMPAFEAFARSIVQAVLADRRSHSRPQPVYAAYGVHMPTMRPRWAYKPDQVCFLVDTSGSMYDELKYVLPVVQYLNQHAISVRLIAGDTRVEVDEVISLGSPLPERLVGGGGTEITPLFERAYEYKPQSLVCFTDGYVPRWPEDEGVQTLWVGTHESPPWGVVA